MVLVLTRRSALLQASAGLLAACAPAAKPLAITIHKDPSCGCCTGWVEHLRRAGFEISIVETADRTALLARHGVPSQMMSCHTGIVGPYAVEGHVPAADVRRLLREKPDARGLAVPGMPIGSPGMEAPDGWREPYDVFLIRKDGSATVFAHHEGS